MLAALRQASRPGLQAAGLLLAAERRGVAALAAAASGSVQLQLGTVALPWGAAATAVGSSSYSSRSSGWAVQGVLPRWRATQHHNHWGWHQRSPLFNFAGASGDLSKTYHERKLLGWSPRQMYNVVAAVEHYHEFVPWCQRSAVLLRRPPDYLEAELEVGFQVFTERYTSKVTMRCPTMVEALCEDSTLFSHLRNRWELRPGPTPQTTWLTFEVDFAFKNPLYRQLASSFFEEVVQRMMGAFEGRCGQLYGASSLQPQGRAASLGGGGSSVKS